MSPYRTPAEMPVVKPYKHSLWRRFCRVLRRIYIAWLTHEVWPFVNSYMEQRRERRYWWEEGHPHMLRLPPFSEIERLHASLDVRGYRASRQAYWRVREYSKRAKTLYQPGASVTHRGGFDYSAHRRTVETKLIEVVGDTAGTILDIHSAVTQQNKD